MSEALPPTPEETQAAKRYTVVNILRLGAVVAVLFGIAIAQGVVALPYALGVGVALAGLLGFFFAPPLLIKRWKAQDRAENGLDHRDEP